MTDFDDGHFFDPDKDDEEVLFEVKKPKKLRPEQIPEREPKTNE